MKRSIYSAIGALLVCATGATAQNAQEAKDMVLVGRDPLQGRSAYQPVIVEQNGRWIAYIGHHGGSVEVPKPLNPLTGKNENNGTSIVDVTDPKHPTYLTHIPGADGEAESGGAQMVRVCSGKTLPKADKNAVYMLRTFGNLYHEIWNTADPSHPKLVTKITDRITQTHKSFWECDTGIAYLVSGVQGWRARTVAQIYDLSDPAHPVFIRDFGLPGQQPGSTGPVPAQLHGPISTGPKGNRVYFGYGTQSDGVMQIVDRDKLLNGPKEPTEANLLYPQVGRWDMSSMNGAHTAFPLIGMDIDAFAKNKIGKTRNFVLVVDEDLANACQGPHQMAWFVDITVEAKPVSVSTFDVPEESGHFCDRGGRFGAHSSNENMTPIYYKRISFITFFNAGVRAVDIRDPYHPKEIGYFIPASTEATEKRCTKFDDGRPDRCLAATQTNNVEVDDRGYIYITDRWNTGLHILELSGEARKLANFPK